MSNDLAIPDRFFESMKMNRSGRFIASRREALVTAPPSIDRQSRKNRSWNGQTTKRISSYNPRADLSIESLRPKTQEMQVTVKQVSAPGIDWSEVQRSG